MRLSRFSLLPELWRYIRETRNIAFSMFMVLLFLLGLVIVLTESSAVMPFIYTLF